ncbi:MAG: linear amide C-N hydrolase [Mycobacterium sp.]
MCTRVLYLGDNGRVVTGRSMDWKYEIGTNLWVMPRGVRRSGLAGPNSVEWTAEYGSVIASGYDVCSTDGLNEAGLAANLLWLAESTYPSQAPAGRGISLALWAQYVLDNFGTVAEAVSALTADPLAVLTAQVPGLDEDATVHLSIADKTGDSAIFEYIDGRQVVHHGRDYQVMTNSPVFEQQLAINEYWKQIGGLVMLPGTNRAADRFVRASFYINAIPKTDDSFLSSASVLSVVRNASVPYGITTEAEPNISSTRWRTAIDHKDLRYIFESALSPNTFWVDLKNVDFTTSAKLDLGEGQRTVRAGEVSGCFKAAEPLPFLAVPDQRT